MSIWPGALDFDPDPDSPISTAERNAIKALQLQLQRMLIRQPNQSPGIGGTATPDMAAGWKLRVNCPNGAVTIANPLNAQQGDELTLALQSGGGSTAVIWGNKYLKAGGVAPTLSSVVGAIDVVTFSYDSNVDRWLQMTTPVLAIA
jgi:hypothetical protein